MQYKGKYIHVYNKLHNYQIKNCEFKTRFNNDDGAIVWKFVFYKKLELFYYNYS